MIGRGGDMQLEKNTMMEIKFGGRTPPNGSKFVSGVADAGELPKL